MKHLDKPKMKLPRGAPSVLDVSALQSNTRRRPRPHNSSCCQKPMALVAAGICLGYQDQEPVRPRSAGTHNVLTINVSMRTENTSRKAT